jgi:preprotein translocase subunit SecA
MSFFTKIFGDPNKKVLDKLQPFLLKTNELELSFAKLTDDELKAKTSEFRKRLKEGKALDDILAEAYAAVREASRRTTRMRHFDVQILGGIVLHQGKISEMKTGEGKTLVATLPLYLNALAGKGCHLVTVNDYLARRDAVWMGQIYYALGLSVGCIQHEAAFVYDPEHTRKIQNAKIKNQNENSKLKNDEDKLDEERDRLGSFKVFYDYLRPVSRKEAYLADITYGTNNEFGFDYLKDNMVADLSQMVQRELHYAIVDEVDSILIDEARTPLIISAPAEESTAMYQQFARLITRLQENVDYNIDEKMKAATLTEEGITKIEKMLGVKNVYEEGGIQLVHHIEEALKAHTLFLRDRDYVVKNGEVIIVDEFTGRLMPGRRYSEGLHQAIEAKERVEVKKESRTLATITFQNYFRMYKKLAGMTGTAVTSAEEFANVYKLDVVSIPTNETMIREDLNDRIYKSEFGKFKAIALDVKARHEKGQPVLIGTVSIEKNERLGEMLTREGIPHKILNAKNHEKEAEIIAQAGRLGAVTCATNMAGRGVDIILGGNPPDPNESEQIKKVGGLHVIGTERHEARRIDNQLRGRAGRQGDPGSSQFYVSLDDDLMRIFGSDRMKSILNTLRLPEDQPIENRIITHSIESAQNKVEANNLDIRKHVLKYDDVMNKHREVIYKRRKDLLSSWARDKKELEGKTLLPEEKQAPSLKDRMLELVGEEIEQVISRHTTGDTRSEWDIEEIFETVKTIFQPPQDIHIKLEEIRKNTSDTTNGAETRTNIIEYINSLARERYEEWEKKLTPQIARQVERAVLLRSINTLWIDHLDAMTTLREGIGLRGYGQRDPLVEYKKEAYLLFQQLLESIRNQIVYTIYKVGAVVKKSPLENKNVRMSGAAKGEEKAKPMRSEKIGRNDPCPCGSGKKYKKCCGK